MIKHIKRATRATAAAMIAVTFVIPGLSAAAAEIWDNGDSYWVYGTASSGGNQYAWSRFEQYARNHGSSAYGDRDGLVRSACQAPGVRAYAESRYSLVGGSKNWYWRYC